MDEESNEDLKDVVWCEAHPIMHVNSLPVDRSSHCQTVAYYKPRFFVCLSFSPKDSCFSEHLVDEQIKSLRSLDREQGYMLDLFTYSGRWGFKVYCIDFC